MTIGFKLGEWGFEALHPGAKRWTALSIRGEREGREEAAMARLTSKEVKMGRRIHILRVLTPTFMIEYETTRPIEARTARSPRERIQARYPCLC